MAFLNILKENTKLFLAWLLLHGTAVSCEQGNMINNKSRTNTISFCSSLAGMSVYYKYLKKDNEL